ncbi:MAG TPA: hypothetical protein VGG19_02455 [Tepidisphaeraceae bacterium]|jgi:hypothetical protein
MQLNRKLLTKLGAILFGIAWINFMVFWVVAVVIGGDALNGEVENGHYFVSSHGRLTEVSEKMWHFSRAQEISVWITHPIGLVLGGGLMWLGSRRVKQGVESPSDSSGY